MTKRKELPPDDLSPIPVPRQDSQALIRAPYGAVAITRDPQTILHEASKAAAALMQVVEGKKHKVIMNNQLYLVYEDWLTVGRFYNTIPMIRSTKLVQIEMENRLVIGYEAIADLIDIATREVLSSADAMCMNDEENWSTRTKYAWAYVKRSGGHSIEDPGKDELIWVPNPKKPGSKRPKQERIVVGEEAVPLFQLRSMAQTRAAAKVLREAFSWVVVLAGFAPTPAEEIIELQAQVQGEPERTSEEWNPPDNAYDAPPDVAPPPPSPPKERAVQPKPGTAVRGETAPPPPKPDGGTVKTITAAQVKRLWAIATQNGWTEKQVHHVLKAELKVEHVEHIPAGRNTYDRFVDQILSQTPGGYGR